MENYGSGVGTLLEGSGRVFVVCFSMVEGYCAYSRTWKLKLVQFRGGKACRNWWGGTISWNDK